MNLLLKTILGFMVCLACVLSLGCDACDECDECGDTEMAELIQLEIRVIAPADVAYIRAEIFEGEDNRGRKVEEATRPLDQFGTDTTLLVDLPANAYFVFVEAFDDGDVLIYEGSATVRVEPGLENYLPIILNYGWRDERVAPRILALKVQARTFLLDKPDGGVDGGAEPDRYGILAYADESITFIANVRDLDGDQVTVTWAMKDGPDKTDADAGRISPLPGDLAINWRHNISGVYYVHITATDETGLSSEAAFHFTVKIE